LKSRMGAFRIRIDQQWRPDEAKTAIVSSSLFLILHWFFTRFTACLKLSE
jgi:hypothetical protein